MFFHPKPHDLNHDLIFYCTHNQLCVPQQISQCLENLGYITLTGARKQKEKAINVLMISRWVCANIDLITHYKDTQKCVAKKDPPLQNKKTYAHRDPKLRIPFGYSREKTRPVLQSIICVINFLSGDCHSKNNFAYYNELGIPFCGLLSARAQQLCTQSDLGGCIFFT